MRPRLAFGLFAALVSLSSVGRAQDRSAQSDRFTDGLLPGDYLRLSGGVMAPVNAQGSLRDWDRGTVYGIVWENWQSGAGGVGRVGYGIGVNYGLLPLNEQQFLSEFLTPQGTRATSASASDASVLEIETNLRLRIPAPFIMPSVSLGFGYINYRPSTISYTADGTSSATAEQRRYGGEFSIGGGLDKRIVDRVDFGAKIIEGRSSQGADGRGHGGGWIDRPVIVPKPRKIKVNIDMGRGST